MTNMVFTERILIKSMLSMAPYIVFAPNIRKTQNANTGRRTQTLLLSGLVYLYLVPVPCASRWRVSVVAHNSRAIEHHGSQSSPDPRTAAWSATPRTLPPVGEEPPSNSARSPSRYSQRGTQFSSVHYNINCFLVEFYCNLLVLQGTDNTY